MSLSTITGASSVRRRIAPIGTFDHPLRFGARAMTTPRVRSTAPGAPAATASRLDGGTSTSRNNFPKLRRHDGQQGLGCTTRRRLDRAMEERVASQIGDRQPRAAGPQVQPGHHAMPRVEVHERRPPAAARRTRPHVADQTEADQLTGELTDRRCRESRGADQLGPRERGRAVHDDAEHAFQVQCPQMRRLTDTIVGSPCFQRASCERGHVRQSVRKLLAAGNVQRQLSILFAR